MKANTIEEFFGTLQQATVEAWKKHLKTDKYSKHVALNDFYEDIVELVDTLIEDYMGIYGKVEEYKNIMSSEKMGTIEYLEELRDLCKSSSKGLFKEEDTELFSDLDNIISLIDSTLYKLKELKEGTVGLKNYLMEKFSNLNESQETTYHVVFSEAYDRTGRTYEVKISVPKQHQREFENFIEDNLRTLFDDAWGGNLEIEPN